MINRRELLERFGDTEFLAELWARARAELPERLAAARGLANGEVEAPPAELSGRLHKLRGLIGNFLTEQGAMPLLVRCERLVEGGRFEELRPLWVEFETLLAREVENLEGWLKKEQ